eukprot:Lithocolla_globosa_v1_NODE_4909_length_1340_cov_20.334630.p3 type:complete len:113 gc:universal NODE_4909_length_1340_cov_20.334630:579-241(-)
MKSPTAQLPAWFRSAPTTARWERQRPPCSNATAPTQWRTSNGCWLYNTQSQSHPTQLVHFSNLLLLLLLLVLLPLHLSPLLDVLLRSVIRVKYTGLRPCMWQGCFWVTSRQL